MTRTMATTETAAGSLAPRRRLAAVTVAHTAVDVYAALVPPLLGVLEVRCQLSAAQTAWLLGVGSLASGLSQPLSAWLSDATDSRSLGALGLVMAAVCLSFIGVADDFASLVTLYALGMIGVGMFHPIGASTMGQLSGPRRSLGLSIFFVAGMIGGITGSIMAPRLAAQPGGFEMLRYLTVPGLLLAALLQVAIGRVPHRHHEHHTISFDRTAIRRRWTMVGLLYVASAMRFTVNMALLYLFVRWAQGLVAEAHAGWDDRAIAEAAAPVVGNLAALLVAGMAVGGLVAGTLVRTGRERWPLVLTPVVFAPAIALFPAAGVAMGYVLAVASGIGFAAMVPVSLGLAQRLLPHRTSLASGMMLGGAWAIALLGPQLAERVLAAGLGLGWAFGLTAALLVLSGLACLPIRHVD